MPIPSAKEIWDLVKSGATIEAQEKIMELRQALLDEQEKTARLTQQLGDAEHRLELRGLKFERAAYWKDNDGPYCQRCADADAKLIRVHDYESGAGKGWRCHACAQTFYYHSNPPATPPGGGTWMSR
jgi:hypothetical protein